MRAFFDFVKQLLVKLDGYWIESAGHPILIQGTFVPGTTKDTLYIENKHFEAITPTVIYGFYDYPTIQNLTMFGIDAPDEMEVQINADNMYDKLKGPMKIGTLLSIEQSDWIVVNRAWIYNRFIGKYRLQLVCARYQESITTGNNGIHIKTQSKHKVDLDEE